MTESGKNLKIIRPLISGLPIIIIFVTAAIMLASRYLRYTTPMYESTVKIKLADVNEGPSSANLFKDFDVFANTNKIAAEVEMLKSKILIAKALDSLDFNVSVYRLGKLHNTELYYDAPFKVNIQVRDQKWYNRPFFVVIKSLTEFTIMAPGEKTIPGTFGTKYTLKGADVFLSRNDEPLKNNKDFHFLDNYMFVAYEPEKLLDKIISKLDIIPVDKDVPIIRITFANPVPEKAAIMVNRLAETYIQDYVGNKYNAANTVVSFLNNQLTDIGDRLARSENDIENYRDRKNIINIRQETETDLRKIAQLKIQKANLEMSLSAIDTLNEYIQNGKTNFLDLAPNFEAFTDLLSTELIKKIKQLQSDKKDLLLRFTENDEKVIAINEKINDITSYLQESIKNTRKNYEVKYREIDNTIKEDEKVFIGLPGREKDMAIMERNFGLNEKIYNFLHQKRTEAEIARAASISFHRIISKGEIPQHPISPNRVLIIAVSAILALFGSVMLIFTVRTLRAKVNDADTLQKVSQIEIVAEVPMMRNEKTTRTFFNNLAIQMELRQLLSYPAVIAFSSFSNKEGKSFNSANLAKGLVALGRKVLLIDVNGNISQKQNWQLKSAFNRINFSPVTNLDYYRSQEETEDGVIIKSAFQHKLDEWKKIYDVIVIRNEPACASSNALVYMAVSDLNFFVLDSYKTALSKVSDVDLMHDDFKIGNIHFWLNRANYHPNIFQQGWAIIAPVMQKIENRKAS